jgi:hypothetical protein
MRYPKIDQRAFSSRLPLISTTPSYCWVAYCWVAYCWVAYCWVAYCWVAYSRATIIALIPVKGFGA